ncbi:bacteriophage CI repressor [Campylobacter concisus]|uniref:helix-turn-helix domain-containing protein n=1 Tax=Campylobacter concisus TaxID=199 RepID=UPI001883BC8A|nr:helix-turn-helix domain-containing protein [Campylobacter concisus]MBE9829384.1 bacteriophage CI repressor [Campylobacter concisus]
MDKKQHQTLDIVAITQRIDAARRLLDYGKNDFAKQVLNVTRVAYWNVIKENRPPLSWIILLADKYGFSIQWLFYGEGEIFTKKDRP